ncbi:MAG TPA: hypothetical protein VMW65_04650, partial [Chloroflexota bacterium]|nr:hypothetical protein [Chloroflexota bacterium]
TKRLLLVAVGLCLAIFFGLRAWNTHEVMVDQDRLVSGSQVRMANDANGTSSNPVMLSNHTINPLLSSRLELETDLKNATIGLAFGLLAIALGLSSTIRTRRKSANTAVPVTSAGLLVQIGRSLWECGEIIAGSLLCDLLIVSALFASGDLLQGAPPTPSLIGQALIRTTELVAVIGGMLS